MAIGLAVLMVPAWHQALSIPVPAGLYWYLAILAYHVASYLCVGRRFARPAIFGSLCLDVLVLLFLVGASGGIKSPLMPTQLVLTMLFALLFPSPLALIPPLLTLPVVVKLDQILGTQSLPGDLLLLLWYSALNVTVVYIIVYLEGRERIAFDEVVRLQRERRMDALASQRARIAREIHDGVGAALSGMVLQSEYLAERVEGEALRGEVQALREAAAEGMEELRRAVSMLHHEFQLASTIPDYVAAYAGRHPLAVECQVSGNEPELTPERQLVLFRILQEALSNVVQHARANSTTVRLAFEPTGVRLEVQDDGTGFDAAAEQAGRGHYGLRNMRERVTKVGGTFALESESGRGTHVRVTMPAGAGGETGELPIG